MNTTSSIFTSTATSENTDCGVHEWNKIQSYAEKIKFSVSYTEKLNILYRFHWEISVFHWKAYKKLHVVVVIKFD